MKLLLIAIVALVVVASVASAAQPKVQPAKAQASAQSKAPTVQAKVLTTAQPKVQSTPEPSDVIDGELVIVPRTEWGAHASKHPLSKLDTNPPPYAIIIHTSSGICLSKSKCLFHMKNIQDMHVKQRGFDDIAYNFLIGGDGNVYEGRGWDVAGTHTPSYDKKSLGIAFLGDFSYKMPTQAQVEAAKKLLDFAVEENKLSPDYKLVGQRQVMVSTQSPGHKLFNIIKTWEHFTESP